MALYVQQRLRLTRLHMIPAAEPVHRQRPQASAEQRFIMLQLALLPFPALIPDRCEIDRQGPSYTIDTLKYFRQRYDVSLCLAVGYDAFCAFSSWHEWQRIPDYAHIAVLRRDHDNQIDIKDFPAELQQMVNALRIDEQEFATNTRQHTHGHLVFLQNPRFFESSSAIRAAVHSGASIRHRIPLATADYIERAGLYR